MGYGSMIPILCYQVRKSILIYIYNPAALYGNFMRISKRGLPNISTIIRSNYQGGEARMTDGRRLPRSSGKSTKPWPVNQQSRWIPKCLKTISLTKTPSSDRPLVRLDGDVACPSVTGVARIFPLWMGGRFSCASWKSTHPCLVTRLRRQIPQLCNTITLTKSPLVSSPLEWVTVAWYLFCVTRWENQYWSIYTTLPPSVGILWEYPRGTSPISQQ